MSALRVMPVAVLAVAVSSLALQACTSKAEGTGRPSTSAQGGAASGGRADLAGRSGGGTPGSGSVGGDAGSGASSAARSGNGGRGGSVASGRGGQATGGDGAAGSNGGTSPMGRGGQGGSAGTTAAGAGTSTSNGDAGDAGASGCSPSDEFNGTTLDACWRTLNGTVEMPLIQIAEQNGSLHLSANGNQGGVWYQGATRSLVYQQVSSSWFTLTTSARPRKQTAPDSLPTKDLHVGGLMVRSPSSSGGSTENYLFVMVGHSENNNGMVHQGVEFKSTVNGCSDWTEPDWGPDAEDPDAELRICRLDTEFRLFKRIPGASTWTPAAPPTPVSCTGNQVSGNVLTRADLPETVQVGLALNFNAPSDLHVAFDYVHFEELPPGAVAEDCASD